MAATPKWTADPAETLERWQTFLTSMEHMKDEMPMWVVAGVVVTFGDLRNLVRLAEE